MKFVTYCLLINCSILNKTISVKEEFSAIAITALLEREFLLVEEKLYLFSLFFFFIFVLFYFGFHFYFSLFWT